MTMKRFIKIILIAILVLAIYSLMPVAWLYLKPQGPLPPTNSQTIDSLKTNKGKYFEFIVFGDCHSGLVLDDSATLRVVKMINRELRYKKIPIDFVMVTGDLTFRGTEWDYKNYNKIRSLIRWPVLSAIGNHDDDNGGETRFDKYIGAREFSFRNRNSYFIVVDNITNDMTETQFEKLEEDLKIAQDYKHRFVILHKPPMSLYQQSWYKPETSSWSYRFMKLCERYKVDMVFSGHEHMFKTNSYGGVRYFMSGGGGMITKTPEADGGYLNYLVIRVYKDYLDYEVRKVHPPFWEVITYYMWKNLVFFIRDAIL
jgi:predicted phosphodiesterase